jgi:4-amino-4-deoxy-L-arabinose transferase-like glycosyltransferase
MLTRLNHRVGHHVLLIGAGLLLFFTNLGGPSLWDLDEGKNSACSGEMRESANWVIPTFNGVLRPDKPALLYWLQIAAYDTFGVNEFAARLPSALAALATVLLCYELARSMFTPTTGLLAGLVAAGTPMLCSAARFANPDALLNLFVALTLALFWLGWQRPRLWWFVAIGAAEGCGMLAKGAVAVVLPVGIIAVFLIWQRRPWVLLDRRNLAGALAFILVAAPWYVRVTVETKGEFARVFFLGHHLDRFVNTMENHRGGLWYYAVVIVLGMVPWAIFLGPAVWYGFWSAFNQPGAPWRQWWTAAADNACDANACAATEPALVDRRIAAYRLLGCWIGLFLIFFSISATKLPNYALPVVVPTAIVIARFLDRWRLGELRIAGWVLPASLACLGLTGVGLAVGLLIAGGAVPTDFMRGQPFTELRPWALLGVVLFLGGLGGAWCLRADWRGAMIACIAVSGLVLLTAIGAKGVTALESHKSARALVAEVGAFERSHDVRVVSWQLDHLPSLNFYVQRDVQICTDASEVRSYLHYPLPVFVFLPASEWARLKDGVDVPWRELARRPDLYKHEDVVVISNQ